ncbi:hypothetical protein K3179_00335 [Qipengyuania sp. GH38]|uniref:hypothetical protein n=1 Tax=Qipengyuania intermedia TaxID=2867244 RepID=UPI001C87AD0D|nr:hypothetical protein [Qipengyuania intermedia]MBX7512984.1 hypothetical protein [Qipengyuania intermedia]
MATQEPSDLLTSIIALLRDFWRRNEGNAGFRTATLRAAEAIMPAPSDKEAHERDLAELLASEPVATAVGLLGAEPGELSAEDLAALLAAAQSLDEWHRPIANDLSGETWQVRTAPHIEAQTRLNVEGVYNTNKNLGLLVPRHCSDFHLCPTDWLEAEVLKDFATGDETTVHFDARHYLQFTCMLPVRITASAPDGGAGPDRAIAVERKGVAADVLVPNRDTPHRILVAPVLEAKDEVTLSSNGTRYRVVSHDFEDRAATIVEAAYTQQGSILFIPEMALSDSSYRALRAALRASHSTSSAGGTLPHLAYAIVGVMSHEGVSPRNFVAVLAGNGRVLAEQDKISRWDLTPEEQRWLGLGKDDDILPDSLKESIAPAERVTLLDLPGFGRLMVLICADMSIEEPGDFLYVNGGVNWVYAPIMDRTWRPKRDGSEENWIVARSLRAARASRGNVVVTNSMPLTTVCNETNAARGIGYPPSPVCHVALMLDGRDQNPASAFKDVDLRRSDVVVCEDWYDGWETFFPPK